MYKLVNLFIYCILSLGIVSASQHETTPVVWGGGKVSPFARKVLIALEYKGLSYSNHDIFPAALLRVLNEEIPKDFAEASPLGKIPAYQEGNFSIADSSVILAYLEKSHPENPLYPKNPELMARALWLEKYGDTVLSGVSHTLIAESIINPKILKKASNKVAIQKAIKEDLPPMLAYLEKQLNASWAGRYFIGDHMSVADIAISTHLVSLQLLDININKRLYPKLSSYLEEILKEPSFKQVLE